MLQRWRFVELGEKLGAGVTIDVCLISRFHCSPAACDVISPGTYVNVFNCKLPSEPDVRLQKQQRLIVRNLNFHAKEEDLAEAFSEFGPLSEVSKMRPAPVVGPGSQIECGERKIDIRQESVVELRASPRRFDWRTVAVAAKPRQRV